MVVGYKPSVTNQVRGQFHVKALRAKFRGALRAADFRY